MTLWTREELSRIEGADELEIAALRRDGTLRKPVTIWVVRDGDDLYVRSAYGQGAKWYQGTQARHEGRIWSAGIEKDVTFEAAGPALDDQLDAAYRTKYGRYPKQYVDHVTSPEARATTLRLVPR